MPLEMNIPHRFSGRSVFLASLLAPLFVGAPVLLVAISSAIFVFPAAGLGAKVGFEEVFAFALNAFIPLYLILVAGCLASSLALKHLGMLRKGTFLWVAAIAAVIVSIPISCDWSTSCDAHDFLLNFALFTVASAIGLAALVLGWWWVATVVSGKAVRR